MVPALLTTWSVRRCGPEGELDDHPNRRSEFHSLLEGPSQPDVPHRSYEMAAVPSDEIINPPEAVVKTALISSLDKYQEMYDESINKPEEFWVGSHIVCCCAGQHPRSLHVDLYVLCSEGIAA